MIPFNGDWLDPEFLELFKKALRENNVDGNIYYCVDNGQKSGYIFLSSTQHEFIQKHYPVAKRRLASSAEIPGIFYSVAVMPF